MYTPPHFQVRDSETLTAFLRQHSFAALITVADGEPFATHLPLLYQRETNTLIGHLATANPQCGHLEQGGSVLAVFAGPHGYISPRWYTHAPAVPTWNYTAVHAYGTPRLITEPEALTQILLTLEAHFEAEPIDYDDAFFAPKLKGIIGVELTITRLEGKFKLSQNIPAESRAKVIETLRAEGNTPLAEQMETTK